MKNYILLFLFVFISVRADYKKLEAYGETLYNLIAEFVQTNSTSNPENVLNYINSDDTKTVFTDAATSTYSRKQVLFSAYQTSFSVGTPVKVIINGLHDALKQSDQVDQAVFYSVWTNLGTTGVLLIGLTRWIYVYVRFDKPVINWVRNQHASGRLEIRTNVTGTNTNNTTDTTPLVYPPVVPDPFFG